jgi:predicted peptidase
MREGALSGLRRPRLLAILLPLLLALVFPVVAAAPASAAEPTFVRADIIAEVQPLDYYVTAVAIEYSDVVDVGAAGIPTSAYTVVATLRGQGAPQVRTRTVTRVYTNDTAEKTATGRPGRFVIVELVTPEQGSATKFFTFPAFLNVLYPLEGAYRITQNAPIVGASGQVVVPVPAAPMVNTSVITPVIDEFSHASYSSPNGQTVNYRFFQPRAYRASPTSTTKYPLVLTLHGAGERGFDNVLPIVGNQIAYAFAKPERQAGSPAFVMSPQAPPGTAGAEGWTGPDMQQALIEMVDRAVATYPIDPDRIYLSGLSMGSYGSWALLPANPYKFAGALLVTGAGDPAQMSKLTHLPIWATHSRDDRTVLYDTPVSDRSLIDAIEAAGAPAVRGEWAGNLPEAEAEARAAALLAQARGIGSHTLFTTYTTGTTPGNAHWSWVPTYLNDVMIDWLYSNVRTSFVSVPARIDALLASGRISRTAASSVLDRIDRARQAAAVGREAVAIGYLQQALARARNQIKGDADDVAVRAEIVALLETLLAEQKWYDDAENALRDAA